HHDERGQDIGGQRRGQGGAQTGAEQSRSSGGNDDLTVDRDLACIGNGRRGRTENGAEFIGAQQRGQRRVGGGDQESGQQQQAPSPDDGVDPARGYGHQQEQTEDLKVHVSVDEGRGRTDHVVFWCGRKDVGAIFVHLLVRLSINFAFTM